MAGRHLTLLVPGLFGPESDPEAGDGSALHDAAVLTGGLELPHLTRLLSRSRLKVCEPRESSLEALYFKTFEYRLAAGLDLPVAALTAKIDKLAPGRGNWLRADPVYLRPDLGRLIVRDNRDLNLRADEAGELATELNRELCDLELELRPASPDRWYLQLKSRPRLYSVSPASAHGRDADVCLVRGEDAGYWHQIQNQIQMLLHQSPVNVAREARGQVPVNSLWFWGAGAMPDPPARVWAQVCSDDMLIEALARHSGSPVEACPDTPGPWLAELPREECLVVIQSAAQALQIHDRYQWQCALEALEADWLNPLATALTTGERDMLTVDGGGGRQFVLTARNSRKWWQRDKTLQNLFCLARTSSA